MKGRIFIWDASKKKVVEVKEAPKAKKRAWAAPAPSISIGTTVAQIPENIEFNKKHGIRHTEYDSVGRPLFTSARHQAEYARSRGCHNADGIFS